MDKILPQDSSSWAKVAWRHAEHLVRRCVIAPGIPGRGSATEAEQSAALYVRARLAAMGWENIRTQQFQGLRSIWLFVGLAFGFALVGHVAYWLLRVPLGEWVAWAVSLCAFAWSAYLFWRRFTFRKFPLQSSLPHGSSQNVIAVLPAKDEALHKVVICAHLDSHRAVWWYTADFTVLLYAFLTPVAIYGLVLAPAFYGLVALTGFRWLVWGGVMLAGLHFLAWFTGMTADLGPYSPGANDNAAAVGTVLAIAERLRHQPLVHTEVWLAFTGCEETGCDGMAAFLDTYRDELGEAFFLDLELVGIGERLVYLANEGLVVGQSIHPKTARLVETVGREFGLQAINGIIFGGFTEMGVVWRRSLPGVCLLAMRSDSLLPPEWHRLSDVPERLNPATLERCHDLVWALLQHLDVPRDRDL